MLNPNQVDSRCTFNAQKQRIQRLKVCGLGPLGFWIDNLPTLSCTIIIECLGSLASRQRRCRSFATQCLIANSLFLLVIW